MRGYRRRKPEEDGYDEIRVIGICPLNPDSEVVIAPVEFGPTLSVNEDSLLEAFERDEALDLPDADAEIDGVWGEADPTRPPLPVSGIREVS